MFKRSRFLLLFAPALLFVMFAFVPGAVASFGLEKFAIGVTNQNGSPDVQAGSHPYALTTTFVLNQAPETKIEGERGKFVLPEGNPKDVRLELPPGFVGDPNATLKCSYIAFIKLECSNETVVGIASTYFTSPTGFQEPNDLNSPLYNLEPPVGVAAEFGFLAGNSTPVFLDTTVRTGGDYGLTTRVSDINQTLDIFASKVTLWGVPADPIHNDLRGSCLKIGNKPLNPYEPDGLAEGKDERESPLAGPEKGGLPESFGECPVQTPPLPLLMNPTSCGQPRTATLSVDSWEEPGDFSGERTRSASMPELVGCEKLDFSPTIGVEPDGTGGSTPTGLNVGLHVPQEGTVNPVGLGEADVKNTTVALPEGVQISPSAADGLLACTPAEIGLYTAEAPTCPQASKVGTVEANTPLLPEPLTGAVYLATQDENPFGSLIALYVFAEAPVAGVRIKVAGQVSLDPVTGQLVTTFENTPQLPYSDFKLDFFGTDRAPLSTPPLCGTYTTQASFEPWSGGPAAKPTSHFQITSGPNGAPCQSPRAVSAWV